MINLSQTAETYKSVIPRRLVLVPGPALPLAREGFIDCNGIGCEINAIRLNIDCNEELFLSCYACRHLLMHVPSCGWKIKRNSREEIAQRREDAREQHAPRIGAGWEALRKMRKAA